MPPQRASFPETEPNDIITLANLIVIGDTVRGVMNHESDVDVFAIDVSAGTLVDFEVQSREARSNLILDLLDVDSTTYLGGNLEYYGADARFYPHVAVLVHGDAFLRDANGAMTSRLVSTNHYFSGLIETNPAGTSVPGLRIGPALLVLSDPRRPDAVMGAAYADMLRTALPGAEATWRLEGGSLPPGLALDSLTGTIAGVAEEAGAFSFTLSVSVQERSTQRSFSLDVLEPSLDRAGVMDELLSGGALGEDARRYLDLQGNRNGRLDVGDVSVWLEGHP